jgi:maleamate amidohydrolase
MDQAQTDTFAEYRRKGFADRSGFGKSPALLVVDFINGFTDPTTGLGGDFSKELTVTAELLEAFRAAELPIFYTTVAYEPHFRDAGVFIKKVPALSILVKGSAMVEVDARIPPAFGEPVLEKKYASAFFGTDLHARLQALAVDTIVMAGCTTSGCIRASAIDSLQNGYLTMVVEDAVGDRADGPHQANLFDIDAKYGDVVPSGEVLKALRDRSTGTADRVQADFRRWWNQTASAP